MRRKPTIRRLAATFLAMTMCSVASARLPAPTPEQQQAAAAKKQQAAAQAEKEKQQLAESMDRVAERWRARATENGWDASAPVPVTTGGINSQARQQGDTSGLPIRSEKLGTAPPSADVKNPAEKGK